MRFVVAALVALFVFVPAAQAEVTFTGVPPGPTNASNFDVGFSSPGAVRFDCVHVFPDTAPIEYLGCTSPFAFRDLADGRHELQVTATDAEGATTQNTAVVIVDRQEPAAPAIATPTDGALLAQPIVSLSGTTEPGSSVTVFDGETALGSVTAQGGSWTLETAALADGAHSFTTIARDAAGNASPGSVPVRVTIDTTAPAAVEPTQTGASEFSFAGEAGARYECRLSGPGNNAEFVPCGSPHAYQGLGPGDYTFSLQTIDAAGNRAATVATRAFSIAAPPAARPAPPAMPAPAPLVVPTVAPAAALGKTVVIRPLRGKVYVRRPGATPTELSAPAAVTVGSEIDVRKGRVRLTAAATGGKAAHRAEFFGGMFVVTQANDGVVELALSERLGSCAKKTGTRVRQLWGDGKGRFRTRGRNAVVTVRGTRWLVQDSCDGTLARVSQGVVSVRDTVKRKTFLVRAGRKYLAVTKRK